MRMRNVFVSVLVVGLGMFTFVPGCGGRDCEYDFDCDTPCTDGMCDNGTCKVRRNREDGPINPHPPHAPVGDGCKFEACKDGKLILENIPDGQKVRGNSGQTYGDCRINVCIGGVATLKEDKKDPPQTELACVSCTTDADCPTPINNECKTGAVSCLDGLCIGENKPTGTVVARQSSGDCKTNVCWEWTGGVGEIFDGDSTDILDDNNPCTVDACTNISPQTTALAAGVVCSGSGVCDGAGNCVECNVDADCQTGICISNLCAPVTCTDGLQGGNETDVDCGGSCGPTCADGSGCFTSGDCQSGICITNFCALPTCTDGVKNGDETDVDCGGPCGPTCGPLLRCKAALDCRGGAPCSGEVGGVCIPGCNDAVQNNTESDVDCGGNCRPCGGGKTCVYDNDCQSGHCSAGMCSESDPYLVISGDDMGSTPSGWMVSHWSLIDPAGQLVGDGEGNLLSSWWPTQNSPPPNYGVFIAFSYEAYNPEDNEECKYHPLVVTGGDGFSFRWKQGELTCSPITTSLMTAQSAKDSSGYNPVLFNSALGTPGRQLYLIAMPE